MLLLLSLDFVKQSFNVLGFRNATLNWDSNFPDDLIEVNVYQWTFPRTLWTLF